MDYAVVAEMMEKLGEQCVERAGVEPGMEVLDVGCGTGNAAIPAARLGARVTGIEPWAELLAIARERAADAMVEVDWVEAGLERLPFEDGSFDVVVSVGAETPVEELRRVCRGCIAVFALTVLDP
jgi:ubiquinone/menaquinone biosynthesis C-methylase UbiE